MKRRIVRDEVQEAVITINGHLLTFAQSATLRVAISSFAEDLMERGLGEDKYGKLMTQTYLKSLQEINNFIIN